MPKVSITSLLRRFETATREDVFKGADQSEHHAAISAEFTASKKALLEAIKQTKGINRVQFECCASLADITNVVQVCIDVNAVVMVTLGNGSIKVWMNLPENGWHQFLFATPDLAKAAYNKILVALGEREPVPYKPDFINLEEMATGFALDQVFTTTPEGVSNAQIYNKLRMASADLDEQGFSVTEVMENVVVDAVGAVAIVDDLIHEFKRYANELLVG